MDASVPDAPVHLRRATHDDAPALRPLLDAYMRELSPIFGVVPAPDGWFEYAKLPLYWAEPLGRFAYLIEHGGQAAGFALVTRGSPASDNPDDLDVAEFFILDGCRRSGVGRRAAAALWNEVPGHWVVRVSEANAAGIAFWSHAVRAYTCGAFAERVSPGRPHDWRIFRFASAAASTREGD